jgi:hypothetical protein
MRASEGERRCQEARVYYYDLLCQDDAAVPESIRCHVKACPVCRDQMCRLRETLFEAASGPDGINSTDEDMIQTLAEQFRLQDEHLTCSEARPFLAELAAESPPIRIRTPATIHVDRCPQCAKDLAVLRGLGLTAGQLARLGRFFAHSRERDSLEEPPAPPAAATPSRLPVEAVPIPCADVSAADIFDHVIPPGASTERQKALAAHLEACPVCLARVRALHHTIYAILNRADSETTTVHQAAPDDECAHEQAGAIRPCSVAPGESGSDTGGDGSESAQPARRLGLGRSTGVLARISITALSFAGMVLFLWMKPPAASGTNVGDMFKALDRMQYVHVAVKWRGIEPSRESWIARPSNLMATKARSKLTLSDTDHHRKVTIDRQTGVREAEELTTAQCHKIRAGMTGYLLSVLAHLSQDTNVTPPTGVLGPMPASDPDIDVRDLIWVPRLKYPSLHSGWRAYLDRRTGLLLKTEFFDQIPVAGQDPPPFRLIETTFYDYPTKQQMDRDIEAMFSAP